MLLLVLAGFSQVSCEDPVTAVSVVGRADRFGIFRDLVLFNRPLSEGGPFFLDRFEATRAEFGSWRAWQMERSGIPHVAPMPDWFPDFLPQDTVNLYEARSFARWRFCRVPTAEEWRYAFTEGEAYEFPWSDTMRNSDALANTGRLNLGRTTRVGSFASGAARPTGPFDLVGNVAEWTETVADMENDGKPIPFVHVVDANKRVDRVVGLPEWPDFQTPEPGDPPWAESMPLGLRVWLPLWAPVPSEWLEQGEFSYTEATSVDFWIATEHMPGVHAFRRTPGLGCWLPNWSPVPTDWLIEAETDQLKRLVLGGNFRTNVFAKLSDPSRRSDPSALYRHPGEHDPLTGVRIAADPMGLLTALLAYAGPVPSEAARNTLRRFLRQDAHREVFLRVWPHVAARSTGASALRDLLVSELGRE